MSLHVNQSRVESMKLPLMLVLLILALATQARPRDEEGEGKWQVAHEEGGGVNRHNQGLGNCLNKCKKDTGDFGGCWRFCNENDNGKRKKIQPK